MKKEKDAAASLEGIIDRMQDIQRGIQTSGQPASMLELEELKDLGRMYARVVDELANTPGGSARG